MCVCVCVRERDLSSHSHSVFDINLSFPFLLGPRRGLRYHYCVFYQEAFSEKISTAGKWWPRLEALLIPCSPKRNSVQLLNMHLCYLLPTWAEFTKKKRSQQGQDQRARKLGHILRVVAACQAWGGGDALWGTWGRCVGLSWVGPAPWGRGAGGPAGCSWWRRVVGRGPGCPP